MKKTNISDSKSSELSLKERLLPLINKIAQIERGEDNNDSWLLHLKPQIARLLSLKPGQDYTNFSGRPIVIDAKKAHQESSVTYDNKGVLTFRHPDLKKLPLSTFHEGEVKVDLDRQFPDDVTVTFNSLNKALSAIDNSPRRSKDKTLRQFYEEERQIFETKKQEAFLSGRWAPDYGSYVYFQDVGEMHLLAPQYFHRLSLITSTSILNNDPDEGLQWEQVRQILESKVVGVIGASVGGNIRYGYDRDARPLRGKLADNDFLESGNLNRMIGLSVRNLSASRASKLEGMTFERDKELSPELRDILRNPDLITLKNKAQELARLILESDPFMQMDVYDEGVNWENVLQFLLGDGVSEPPVDLIVEEVDKARVKYEIRVLCKLLGIPLMMISDWGDKTEFQFYDWPHQNDGIGFNITDREAFQMLQRAESEKTLSAFFDFVEAICGPAFRDAGVPFGSWVAGHGEQMGSSLPQKGLTALDAGGLGGRKAIQYFLGHKIPKYFVADHLKDEILTA